MTFCGCPLPTTAFAGQDGSSASAASISDLDLIAQAEANGECVPGQAIVVYHASGAAKGSTGELSVESDSDPLAAAGFGTVSTWDLSEADGLASSTGADSDGALTVQSESTGSVIPSGTDLRVALVGREGISVADLVSQLQSLDFVECVQPNYTYESTALNLDDTLSDLQWNLSGNDDQIAGSNNGVGYASALKEDTVSATSGDEIVIAVCDSGVDYNNPDLAYDMWTDPGDIGLGLAGTHGYSGVTGTYDPLPSTKCDSWHGTHCAGIIAATNNNVGVASVSGENSHTKIMGLRNSNDDGVITDAGVAGCYEYLVRARLAGVNVVAVNDSWGGTSPYSPVTDYLVNQAGKAGVLSVFAAGNRSDDLCEDKGIVMLDSPYMIVVASSNEDNDLSAFSSYNKTGVDVAAPGSNILSTYVTYGNAYTSARHFNPLLSYKAGKDTAAEGMLYYTDFKTTNAVTPTVKLMSTNTNKEIGNQDALSVTMGTSDRLDSDALQISVDYDPLKSEGYSVSTVYVDVSWTIDNPFLGKTDWSASDYAVGLAIDAGNLTTSLPMELVTAREGLYSGSDNLVTAGSTSAAAADAGSMDSGVLTSLDTTSSTLRADLQLVCRYRGTDADPTGAWNYKITGYGVGRVTSSNDPTSAYVPYCYESGTSMAAPLVAGSIGELAALYPNDTSLQLRGLVCDGTTPLATADDQAKVASGGRFTFENALDNSKVNASTWSITTSGANVTVHGYNLEDATLTVDGETVQPTAQTAGTITFEAGEGLFDGGAHRFDVTDGTTGVTYKAAYVTPSGEAKSLANLGAVPSADVSNGSAIVSTPGGLLYAAGDGSFLYSCSDPSPSASWTELAPAGDPWDGAQGTSNINHDIVYTYANGKVYAFAFVCLPAAPSGGYPQLSVRQASTTSRPTRGLDSARLTGGLLYQRVPSQHAP